MRKHKAPITKFSVSLIYNHYHKAAHKDYKATMVTIRRIAKHNRRGLPLYRAKGFYGRMVKNFIKMRNKRNAQKNLTLKIPSTKIPKR
jgi:hypothetical protein